MPESIRTYAQVMSDLADNNTRLITEQIMRNALHSAMGVSAYSSKTTNYTALESDETLDVDATAGAVTITLPAVATTRVGKRYTVRKVDTSTNAVIVDGNASETIDGDTTQILFTQYTSLTLVNTGTAWLIKDQYGVLAGRLFLATASATVANTVTETTLIGSGVGTLTLPANFWRVGRSIKIYAAGVISDTGTPTVRFRTKLDSTSIIDSTAIALSGTLSNTGWELTADLICRTAGGSGTIFGQGSFHYGADNRIPLSAVAAVTIDTSASDALNLTIEWGAASASNTITCTHFRAEWVS